MENGLLSTNIATYHQKHWYCGIRPSVSELVETEKDGYPVSIAQSVFHNLIDIDLIRRFSTSSTSLGFVIPLI